MWLRLMLFFPLLWLLHACASSKDYTPPSFKAKDTWHAQHMLGQLKLDETLNPFAEGDWWRNMHDPVLNQLITEASQNNRDLAVALANIERAKASVDLASAGYLPTLQANANASRNRYSKQNSFGTNSGTRNTFNAGLQASWEPDFFGRTRYAVAAAQANLGMQQAMQQDLLLAVVAEVASNYFQVRGLQRQLASAQQDIQLLQDIEEIARVQAENGITTRFDLARAQGEREAYQARLPNLEAEINTRIYRIAVLTGQTPETHAQLLQKYAPLAMPPDRLPVGLRSDILKRRPDIQQAERAFAAATANASYAHADRFPSFLLTGAIGSSTRVFSDLFSAASLTNSIATALAWPIYAGGAFEANIDIADAETQAALASYEQSVLLALEDAESALMRYGKAWQTLKQLKIAEETRQQAMAIAKLRYEAGEESLLTVIDAKRTLIATGNDIINSETNILVDLALLYKALGGGWQVAP